MGLDVTLCLRIHPRLRQQAAEAARAQGLKAAEWWRQAGLRALAGHRTHEDGRRLP
jgi:hypothetical protein